MIAILVLAAVLPVQVAAASLQFDLPESVTAADYRQVDERKAKLGQLLFYDPILSGNRNIACATCHHPDLGTSDGLSLGIGEGGVGLGTDRTTGTSEDRIKKRIPRNAPGLWNLGAHEFTVLFHDGRLSVSDNYGNGFDSPAEEWLPVGFSSVVAAQAVLPLTAQFEMAGNPKENEIAGAAHDRIDAPWPIIAKRVRVNSEYGELFVDAFDEIENPPDVTIVHIAEAIAAFIEFEWQSSDSPFDAWLAGESAALDAEQLAGMRLFFGKAKCAQCHSGKFFTDHAFHALALPQFGPGRTRLFDPTVRDVGHMGESDRLEDAYRFRTPSLRNVTLTAPYGHNGAYPTLEGIVRHHLTPLDSLAKWQPEMAALPRAPWLSDIDFVVFEDRFERERLKRRIDIEPLDLTNLEISQLISFLHTLTGTESIKGRLGVPQRVPSGLALDPRRNPS